MSRRQPILPMHLMKARNLCYLDSLLDISDIPLLVIFDLQNLQGSNVITMSCDEIPTAIWHFTFFVGIINCIIKNSSKDQIHYIFLQDDNFSLPAKQIIDLQHSREYNVIQPWVVMKYLVCNLTCFLVLLNFRWIINHIIKITPKTCQRTTFISPFFRMIYFSLSLLYEL